MSRLPGQACGPGRSGAARPAGPCQPRVPKQGLSFWPLPQSPHGLCDSGWDLRLLLEAVHQAGRPEQDTSLTD